MHKVVLPASGPKPSYYNAYVKYLRNIFEDCGVNVVLQGVVTGTKFIAQIDGKDVVFDFSDHPDIRNDWLHLPYFKFHYWVERFRKHENIHPFAPISFYDWNQFRRLSDVVTYNCVGPILNMQEAKRNALTRRIEVQKMLSEKYGSDFITKWNKSQVEYWKMINKCLVHVFVPGARNNMLDRGHIQYLAFGCCTIAPPITDGLPFGSELFSNVYYVECKEDYSDLIEKIEWCRKNKEFCIEIGNNAKKLFNKTCTPQVLWQWILKNI